MGTRIGYKILGNNHEENDVPAIMLFSNSNTINAEELMRTLGESAIGPTDLMMKISESNIHVSQGKEKYIFTVSSSHEDTEAVWLISFTYSQDFKQKFNMVKV
jgi:hypothetical protein